ncbi:MAG: CRISPR-associated endonuclease Cas2 [Myxococcota bacterium]
MTRPRQLYLVCYDICGEGAEARWRRVYRACRAFGDHLQYSVFRCALTDRQLASFEEELQSVIDPTRDQVLLVPLGEADAANSWSAWTIGFSVDEPERVVRIV